MNAVADLRKEVFRLTRLHLSERRIREELANLAQRKLIPLRSWDGHQLREISSWSNPEEFINSTSDAGDVHAAANATT